MNNAFREFPFGRSKQHNVMAKRLNRPVTPLDNRPAGKHLINQSGSNHV